MLLDIGGCMLVAGRNRLRRSLSAVRVLPRSPVCVFASPALYKLYPPFICSQLDTLYIFSGELSQHRPRISRNEYDLCSSIAPHGARSTAANVCTAPVRHVVNKLYTMKNWNERHKCTKICFLTIIELLHSELKARQSIYALM